jgi:homoserine O-acetyltransferase
MKTIAAIGLTMFAACASAAEPAVTEGDFVLRNFRFASGETLPELRLHYRTLGKVQRDAKGVARNAVLIMHSRANRAMACTRAFRTTATRT